MCNYFYQKVVSSSRSRLTLVAVQNQITSNKKPTKMGKRTNLNVPCGDSDEETFLKNIKKN